MNKIILICICCAMACTESTIASDNDGQAGAYRLQMFAIDPFDEPMGDWAQSFDARSLVIARFGEPITMDVSKRPHRTSSEELTEYVIDYDGLRFWIDENELGDRSWIVAIEVTGNAHALKFGVGIGSSRSDVVAAFNPDEYLIRGNRITLTTNTVQDPPGQEEWHGGTVDVIIYFESERVNKILIIPLRAS